MALKKSEKRLLIILGVVVVAFLVNQFFLSGDKNKTPQKNKYGSSVPGTGQGSGKGENKVSGHVEEESYSDWGRDPFFEEDVDILARKSRERSVTLKLQGIFFKNGEGYVLINNQVLKEGEEKKGIRVEKIEADKVLCRSRGRLVTLRWRKS